MKKNQFASFFRLVNTSFSCTKKICYLFHKHGVKVITLTNGKEDGKKKFSLLRSWLVRTSFLGTKNSAVLTLVKVGVFFSPSSHFQLQSTIISLYDAVQPLK